MRATLLQDTEQFVDFGGAEQAHAAAELFPRHLAGVLDPFDIDGPRGACRARSAIPGPACTDAAPRRARRAG